VSDVDSTSVWADGIVQIRLPMAGNPLRYINAYVVADDDGLTLIDAGWKTDDVLAALHAGLQTHGFGLSDIRRLLITHCHFDHYGLAATLLRAGLGALLMHRLDWALARDHLSDPAALDAAADAWIARNGLRVDTSPDDQLAHHRTELARPTRELAGGERIGRLRAVWTPGHTPGHLCFADEPFADLGRRAAELLAHEALRERQVITALGTVTRSAGDIARMLPWTRRNRAFAELSPAHQQFAVAETLAHLEHLRTRAAVVREEQVDSTVFRSAATER